MSTREHADVELKPDTMKTDPKVVIISAFGLQAELPASKRVCDLLAGFLELGIPARLLTPELPFLTRNSVPDVNLILVKTGLLQVFFENAIGISVRMAQVVRSLITGFKSENLEKAVVKPVYLRSGRLLQFYLFFFYSKRLLPLLRMYKTASKDIQSLSAGPPVIVITSSAPGSMHLIGYLLKRKFGKKIIWVADFQDPLERSELLGIKSNFLYSFTDKLVFKHAQLICYPSPTLHKILDQTARDHGFDISEKLYLLPFAINIPAQACEQRTTPTAKSTKRLLTVFYAGTIYKEMENPLRAFLHALIRSGSYQFLYAGFTSEVVRKIANELRIDSELIKIHDVLPKATVLDLYMHSDILLSLVSFGKEIKVAGSKLFELLATEKPILLIAPEGADYLDLVNEVGGVWISKNRPTDILRCLDEIRKEIVQKKRSVFRNKEAQQRYAAKEIARGLLSRLGAISAGQD